MDFLEKCLKDGIRTQSELGLQNTVYAAVTEGKSEINRAYTVQFRKKRQVNDTKS